MDPDGTLRYASPAFERVLGYDPGEAVGKMNVLDHVHPDDLPRVLAETEKALAEGRAVSQHGGVPLPPHRRLVAVGGVGGHLPARRPAGAAAIVVNVRDVTRRKEAEEAAREGERRLASVVSNAHAYAYRCLNEPGWSTARPTPAPTWS